MKDGDRIKALEIELANLRQTIVVNGQAGQAGHSCNDCCGTNNTPCDSQSGYSQSLVRFNEAASASAIESQRIFLRSIYPVQG